MTLFTKAAQAAGRYAPEVSRAVTETGKRIAGSIGNTEAARRLAGSGLGTFFEKPGVRDFLQKAGLEAGIGVTTEQVLPRVFGQTPEPTFLDSAVRQGIGGLTSVGIAQGLNRKLGVNQNTADFAGFSTGQFIGQTTANALLPGNQAYPIRGEIPSTNTASRFAGSSPIEPEINEAGHAGYDQLLAQQAYKRELANANHQRRLEVIRAQNQPSNVYHHSTVDPMASVQAVMTGRTPQYG